VLPGKGDPRAYPLIAEKFKAAVEARNFGAIIGGMNAMINLADPRGQESFDLVKEKFKGQQGALTFIAGFEARFKAAIGKP
jgi:hypothetical protein